MDYYKVLGVTVEDDHATIKKAYKRLASKCHPDKHVGKVPGMKPDGNMEAKFKEIAEAWEVLKDTDKRKQYDETGQYIDPRQTMQEAEGVFIQAFLACVERGKFVIKDYIPATKGLLRHELENIMREIEPAEEQLENIEKLANSFVVKDGKENMLSGAIRSQLMGLKKQCQQIEHKIVVIETALKALENYSYNGPAQELNVQLQQFTFNTSTSTNGSGF